MKKTIVLLAILATGFIAKGQDYHWRLTYDVSIPMGDLNDQFISATSWRGIGVDNRWYQTDKLSVGAYFGWHVFYEKKSNVLGKDESGAITAFGNQFRYLNTWVAQVNGHYYLGEQGEINPWVGLGVGTAYNVERTELGFVALSFTPWSVSVSPQIGLDIPIGFSTDFTLAVRYNHYFNSQNKARFDYQYIGINAGFKFTVF